MFRRDFLTNLYYKEFYSITSDRSPPFRIKTKKQTLFGLWVNCRYREAHSLAITQSWIVVAKVAGFVFQVVCSVYSLADLISFLNVTGVFLFVFSFDQLKTAVANLKKQANKKNEGSLAYVKGGLSTFFEAQDALSGKDALHLLNTV